MLKPGMFLQKRYEIRNLLGQGGFGAVYRARDQRLQSVVAVKENVGGDARQFEHEAVLLATLKHPNLPRVTDHFIEQNGAQYLVMDYIDGEDLETRLKTRGPLPEQEVLLWFQQIMNAVAYLHQQGVIHRDIKPANIKITPSGHAVLVDFGIAKRQQTGYQTLTGARAVTPGFAAPEQYKGGTDPRTDIYALGATLYALLTRRTPPDALSLMGGAGSLVSPGRINAAISPQTEQAIMRAMALFPHERFASVEAFYRALPKPGGTGPSKTSRPPTKAPTTQITAGVVGVVVFLLVSMGLAMVGVMMMASTPGSPTPAPTSVLVIAPAPANNVAPETAKVVLPSPSPTPMVPTSTLAPTRAPTITPTPLPVSGQLVFTSEGSQGSDVVRLNLTDVVRDPSSVTERRLTNDVFSDRAPVWSPDGELVAFASDREQGNWDLFVLNRDGSNLRRLTTHEAEDLFPAWAPDGGSLVFRSNRDGNRELYILNVEAALQAPDGASEQRLTDNDSDEYNPAWSPDGRWIAFTSTRNGEGDIYVVEVAAALQDPAAAPHRRLTDDPADDNYAAWSPDGRQIAFNSDRGGNYDLFLMDADGTNLRRLTGDPHTDFYPAWSPDGRFLAFSSDRGEQDQIYVLDVAETLRHPPGSDQQLVTKGPFANFWPSWTK